jgi:hypothetical protein
MTPPPRRDGPEPCPDPEFAKPRHEKISEVPDSHAPLPRAAAWQQSCHAAKRPGPDQNLRALIGPIRWLLGSHDCGALKLSPGFPAKWATKNGEARKQVRANRHCIVMLFSHQAILATLTMLFQRVGVSVRWAAGDGSTKTAKAPRRPDNKYSTARQTRGETKSGIQPTAV